MCRLRSGRKFTMNTNRVAEAMKGMDGDRFNLFDDLYCCTMMDDQGVEHYVKVPRTWNNDHTEDWTAVFQPQLVEFMEDVTKLADETRLPMEIKSYRANIVFKRFNQPQMMESAG